MFRLEFLKLKDHPQLGDINLNLSDVEELTNIEKPYTSVIIGANGTGKSFILRTISDIFSQFKANSNTDKKGFSLPYDFHLRYKTDHNSYDIVLRKTFIYQIIGTGKQLMYYKNRPDYFESFDLNVVENQDEYKISIDELEFPKKLIVNSIIPTDRFIYKDSKPR
ncbi:MAG: hypothetical protein IPN86_04340 [Saprospiraceae bacterium]|nr:hypothetical protein [Saprospiraceae bacterium]